MAVTTTPSRSETGNPVGGLPQTFGFQVMAFLGLHILWAYALSFPSWLGQAQAAVVVLYGLRAAIRRDSSRVLYALGYLAGAEVLWRITLTNLLWEFAKYASVVIAGIALLAERWHPRPLLQPEDRAGVKGLSAPSQATRTLSALPIAYFLLLLPGVIPTLKQFYLSMAWKEINFNLSGPLALAALSFYLSRRPINQPELVRLLVAVLGPIVGIAFVAASFTSVSSVTFTRGSNLAMIGTYLSNQVSNLLGLGALAGMIFVTMMRGARFLRVMVLLVTICLIAQASLTLSRGGVVSFLLAVLVFGLHLVGVPLARRGLFVMAGILLLTASVVLPLLNMYTDGALQRRFLESSTSGRISLAKADLRAFQEHPVLGAGVGLSRAYHPSFLKKATIAGGAALAHTEPTRMLAEHGILGLAALLILASMLLSGYRRASPGSAKALTAAFAVWAISIMLHSAMRAVATSLGVGLALAMWNVNTDNPDGNSRTAEAPSQTVDREYRLAP
jgi:O-antigen ligase